MTLTSRSNICTEVTDESMAQTRKMTDQFLKLFYSGYAIESSIYQKKDVLILADGWCLMSLEDHYKYTRWMESLPPLMKELI